MNNAMYEAVLGKLDPHNDGHIPPKVMQQLLVWAKNISRSQQSKIWVTVSTLAKHKNHTYFDVDDVRTTLTLITQAQHQMEISPNIIDYPIPDDGKYTSHDLLSTLCFGDPLHYLVDVLIVALSIYVPPT